MKYISFAAAAIVILGASAAAAAQTAFASETVSSPAGSITAEISCESGIINYNVYKDGISPVCSKTSPPPGTKHDSSPERSAAAL